MNEEYGEREWELPCVCRHLNKDHISRGPNILTGYPKQYCNSCRKKLPDCIHEFKLDNLALIEQVARARGLV